jgi:hypothetical protein
VDIAIELKSVALKADGNILAIGCFYSINIWTLILESVGRLFKFLEISECY